MPSTLHTLAALWCSDAPSGTHFHMRTCVYNRQSHSISLYNQNKYRNIALPQCLSQVSLCV